MPASGDDRYDYDYFDDYEEEDEAGLNKSGMPASGDARYQHS